MLIDAFFHSPSRPRAERDLKTTSQVIDSTIVDLALDCVRLDPIDPFITLFDNHLSHLDLLLYTSPQNFSNLVYF